MLKGEKNPGERVIIGGEFIFQNSGGNKEKNMEGGP